MLNVSQFIADHITGRQKSMFAADIEANRDKLRAEIEGKRVLVIGGAGTIGSSYIRAVLPFRPSKLVVVDISENGLAELTRDLRSTYGMYVPEEYRTYPLSFADPVFEKIFRAEQGFDIVANFSAHKHVRTEKDKYSVQALLENNVLKARKLLDLLSEFPPRHFFCVSTDKAANPVNIMGASKRICEMIIQTFNKHFDTEFVAVRFGNVLGSNGSVIPLFKKQIMEGGPVTVTHPDIIRYFMTIPEAVSLVLQAGAYAKGGEIFVLDMGKPVKILDLARNLIKLSGYRVGEDIKIEFTGLRPGEKLYEELLMEEEGLKETDNKMIYIGKPIELDETEFFVQLKKLKEESRDESNDIRALVKEIVPTYHYADSSSIISIGRTPDMK